MKFEDITLSDLNFVIGAVDFLIYDVADTVDPATLMLLLLLLIQ